MYNTDHRLGRAASKPTGGHSACGLAPLHAFVSVVHCAQLPITYCVDAGSSRAARAHVSELCRAQRTRARGN